jgi:ribosomal-protein-alanine N-acetyltransferase
VSIALQTGERVLLRRPRATDADEFIAAVRRSKSLHGRWVEPPASREAFEHLLKVGRRPNFELHVLENRNGDLVGVFNISEIVRGPLQSGYLGYYSFAPFAGKGLMREGMQLVLCQAFLRYKLHRLEANIQPDNTPSIRLVAGAGFRREGFSPRYLKIAGRWCHHERWAILSEDWSGR